MIAVVVAAATAHENAVGITLLEKVADDTGAVKKALVDQSFTNAVVAHGEKVGIEVEAEERDPAQTGFVPQAKRWIVELVRDYEYQLRTAESRVYWAMTAMIPRRPTGAAAPTWHTA
ncbi:hypothetical protein [Streptomyces violaceusniger]|uniref:hypothetical protein n=1 Tax=Streptomyces violaceusniger TaxID=68280 RepID=UPI00382032A0